MSLGEGFPFGSNFIPDEGLGRTNDSIQDQNPLFFPNIDHGCNQSVIGNVSVNDSLVQCAIPSENDNWPNCISTNLSEASPTTPLFQFLVNGVGISVLALLGIFGNLLSAIVLSRPQMKSSVTCLLLGLTFCDTLLISVSIFVFSLPYIGDYINSPVLWKYEHIYFGLLVPFLYPVSTTAQTGSVYLTLAVTIERYIAVCHSLKARAICTWGRARICVATVIFFAILYNLPRWWEVLSIPVCEPVNNLTIYMNGKSAMRDNPIYVTIYINWSYLVVMYLIPFSGLVIFNLAIYRQVRKANKERQQLTKLQRREMGLATMLLCVVVVFLLCNVLPLVNNILESFYDTSVDQLVALSNFLVVVNSSANFVIYCTCGERFRRLLLRLCRDFLSCRLLARQARNDYRVNLYRKSPDIKGQDFEETSPGSLVTHSGILGTPNPGTINDPVPVDPSRRTNDGCVRGPAIYRLNNLTCSSSSSSREGSSNKTVPIIDVHNPYNVRVSQETHHKPTSASHYGTHQRNGSVSVLDGSITSSVGTTGGGGFGSKRISICGEAERVTLEMKSLHSSGT